MRGDQRVQRAPHRQAAMLNVRTSEQNGLSKQLLVPHQLLILTLIAIAIVCTSLLISNRLSGTSGGIQGFCLSMVYLLGGCIFGRVVEHYRENLLQNTLNTYSEGFMGKLRRLRQSHSGARDVVKHVRVFGTNPGWY